MALEITEQNFEELVLRSDLPVLVDCRKTSAEPDPALAPMLEALSKEFEGRAIIARCNIEDNPGIPAQAGVMNIPMLLYFKDGKVVDRHLGSASKAILAARLNAHV